MGRIRRKASDPARARLFLLAALPFVLVAAFLVLPGSPASSVVRIEFSPPYAVYVRLAYTSPFVADGRSTFAIFEMESVFRKIQFIRTPSPVTGSTDSNFYIAVAGRKVLRGQVRGKGEITNFALNPVDDG